MIVSALPNGGTKGHVIKDADGTAVAQSANLQFTSASVTNENGNTVVKNVIHVDSEDYDPSDIIPDAIYCIDDENTPSVSAEGIRYENGTVKDALDDLNASKVPTGGTTGQALTKHSDANNDVEWTDVATPTYVKNNYASRDLITDTVGWTGKNLFKYDVPSGNSRTVTFTVNSDKTILVNGTPTAGGFSYFHLITATDNVILPAGKYIFSSGYSDAHVSLWLRTPTGATSAINIAILSSASEAEFTLKNDTQIISYMTVDEGATANNVLVKPMIRRATEPAGYEPYHDSVKETLRDAEVIEGKNLFSKWAEFVNTFNSNNGGTKSFDGDTLTVVSGNATLYSGVYLSAIQMTELLNPDALPYPLVVSFDIKANKNCAYMAGTRGSEQIITLEANTWFRQVLIYNNASGLKQEFDFYSYDTSQPTVEVKNMMLCTKEEWDKSHEYKPYYEPLKDRKLDITDAQVLGAWNLFQNNGINGTWNGATFIKNADDTVTVDIAGSAVTANINYLMSYADYHALPQWLQPGTTAYISGCDGGNYSVLDGGSDTFYIYCAFQNSNRIFISATASSKGERQFTVPANAAYYRIGIMITPAAGKLTGKVFSPMISLKPNMPYVKHVMTNKELTDVNSSDFASFNTNNYYSVSGTGHIHKCGKMCMLVVQVKCNSVPTSWVEVLSAGSLPIPVNGDPIYLTVMNTSGTSTAKQLAAGIAADGRLILADGVANYYYNVLFTYIMK